MRPDEERDDVELLDHERVERVGERDRRDQRLREPRSVAIIDPAPAAAPVDPGARMQREEEVRHELGRDQVAHLRRVRVQHEHGRERDGDHRDLVAEERDRLAQPEPPEDEIPAQQRRNEPHQRPKPVQRCAGDAAGEDVGGRPDAAPVPGEAP